MRNLLDNAAHHAAGRVEVSLSTIAGATNGTGAHRPSRRRRRRARCRRSTDRERIFDRFIRLDEARGRDGGGGLGLAIASEVARAHGGAISCDEAAIGGARFTVGSDVALTRHSN